jgi:hypothetical protein
MPYATVTFAQLKQALANRLDDPTKQFFPDAELGLALQDAIRFWNILTGDNRQWFDLPAASPNVWYDLNTAAASPRLCAFTDQDVYRRLQYALLEPPLANAVMTSLQFSTADIVAAVQRKRDEFIFRTGCTSSVRQLNVVPNSQTVALPETVIQARRAYWLPTPSNSPTNPFPLPRTDESQQVAFDQLSSITASVDPYSFSGGIEPPLTIDLYPPPGFPGKVEVVTIESQGLLDPLSPTTFLFPSDFGQAIMWGALADLLDMNSVAKDAQRAQYARQRFEQFVELMMIYPFILAARPAGVPIQVDAIDTLDVYDPTWRTVSANPQVVGTSGQNLLAFPTSVAMNIGLYVLANANLPMLDADFIQLGREVIDVILDLAQHTESFKMGGADFSSTMPLFKSIMELGAQRNRKIAALSTFKAVMDGKQMRENELYPQEVEA